MVAWFKGSLAHAEVDVGWRGIQPKGSNQIKGQRFESYVNSGELSCVES